MKVTTSGIINNIRTDIKKKIEMEEQKLNSINGAYTKVEMFLEDNGHQVSDNDDILVETMKTIKGIKEDKTSHSEDIEKIKGSIEQLKSITINTIDPTIVKNLDDKILSIEEKIKGSDAKLETVKEPLNVLLGLEVVCPACQGNKCALCENMGVVNIAKILEHSKLLEVEYDAGKGVQVNSIKQVEQENPRYPGNQENKVDIPLMKSYRIERK